VRCVWAHWSTADLLFAVIFDVFRHERSTDRRLSGTNLWRKKRICLRQISTIYLCTLEYDVHAPIPVRRAQRKKRGQTLSFTEEGKPLTIVPSSVKSSGIYEGQRYVIPLDRNGKIPSSSVCSLQHKATFFLRLGRFSELFRTSCTN